MVCREHASLSLRSVKSPQRPRHKKCNMPWSKVRKKARAVQKALIKVRDMRGKKVRKMTEHEARNVPSRAQDPGQRARIERAHRPGSEAKAKA